MQRTIVSGRVVGRLSDAWRRCVGTGRFELALRRDYQDSLALVQREIGFRHIRGPRAAQRRRRRLPARTSTAGRARVRLRVHLRGPGDRRLPRPRDRSRSSSSASCPAALASGDQTVFWWRGNVTPPRSCAEWADLVRATVAHLVDRYGLDQVRSWPIEVWNEPNLKEFWAGRRPGRLPPPVRGDRLRGQGRRRRRSRSAARPSPPAPTTGWAPLRRVRHRARRARSTSSAGTPTPPARPSTCRSASHQTLAPAPRPAGAVRQRRASILAGTALAGLPRAHHRVQLVLPARQPDPRHGLPRRLPRAGASRPAATWSTPSPTGRSVTCSRRRACRRRSSTAASACSTHRQIKKPTFHLYAFMARMGEQVLARGADHLVTRDAATAGSRCWPGQPVDVTGRPGEPDRHECG